MKKNYLPGFEVKKDFLALFSQAKTPENRKKAVINASKSPGRIL
jgi:hypothetical protein